MSSNWADFIRFECEKSWAEVAKMKELEVELEQLRQLVVAMMGREEVGCVSDSGGRTVDGKVGKTMREMLGRAHLSLGGG